MFAKFLPEKLNQAAAMAGFFLAHAFKHRGRGGIVLPETFGKIGVHALVFLFQSNGQSQDFALGQFMKLLHGELAYLSMQFGDNHRAQMADR